MAKRKRGVHKGREAPGRWTPPVPNRTGTYGTHRTGDMEDRRAARLREIRERDITAVPCRKFIDADMQELGMALERQADELGCCGRGTLGCSVDHQGLDSPCETY